MSKKKHREAEKTHHPHHLADASEYAIIGRDLVRVVILNIVYLAAVLVVYFTNRNTHYLENFFSRVFHW